MGVEKRTESRSVVEKWRQELISKICLLREVMPQSISNEFRPEKSSVENGFLLERSAGILLGFFYYCKVWRPEIKAIKTEANGFRLALQPLLLAERDRAFIKQLKANRDAEEELMADTEGWEVGTWFGQKVYKTVPDDKLFHYYSNGHISPEWMSHHSQSGRTGIWADLREYAWKFA